MVEKGILKYLSANSLHSQSTKKEIHFIIKTHQINADHEERLEAQILRSPSNRDQQKKRLMVYCIPSAVRKEIDT